MNDLIEQTVYTWDELGEYFGFGPQRFRAGGGMIITKPRRALLLITHPGGAQYIDYKDYWDGDDLIYTGRGLTGDQELSRENLRLATNDMTNLLFEKAGIFRLKYLGTVRCESHWWSEGPDQKNVNRKVLKFRLRFMNSKHRGGGQLTVEEGRELLKLHILRERDKKIIAEAKKKWTSVDPSLCCSICKFSFIEYYGPTGVGYIEAHHNVPLSKLSSGELAITTVEDLSPVCANCHRMLHRRPYPTVDELRSLIST